MLPGQNPWLPLANHAHSCHICKVDLATGTVTAICPTGLTLVPTSADAAQTGETDAKNPNAL